IIFLFVLSFIVIGCSWNEEMEGNTANHTSDTESVEKDTGSDVVTIQDKGFDQADLAFYTLMNQLNIILQMEVTENEKDLAYLEEQMVYFENINVNLQKMIELYAMSLLGEEKNYFVPDEKLLSAVQTFNEKINKSERAVETVKSFGEENYNRNIEEYIRQTMLRDRIAGELEKQLKEENKDAGEREINYLLEKEFEELYSSQLA